MLTDTTNLRIPLSIGSTGEAEEYLEVDADGDSSFDPSAWVHVFLSEYDDVFNMTYEEAGLLHDRLGLILGRSDSNTKSQRQWGAIEKARSSEVFPATSEEAARNWVAERPGSREVRVRYVSENAWVKASA